MPPHSKYHIKIFLVIIATFIFANRTNAQNIEFEHISLKEGLSQSSVKCILQDSKGFMWFGTFDGLNKYDGYKIEVFRNSNDSNSIAGNSISTLFEDHNQNIWIGISGIGLAKYDPVFNKFSLLENNPDNSNSLSNNTVLSICEDRQKNLWIATKNGLNKYNQENNQFEQFYEQDGLHNNFVYKAITDKNGNIWLGTRCGLNLYLANEKQILKIDDFPKKLANKKIRDLYIDDNQILWIATNKGLFSLDVSQTKSSFANINFYDFPENDINAISQQNNGNIWLATNNAGIRIFDIKNQNFSEITYNPLNPKSLTINSVFSVYKDRSGIMWVGTQLGGINKYNILAKPFHTISKNPLDPNTISSNQVRAILEDKNGTIWFGTKNGGLNKWLRNENRFVSYQNNPNDRFSIPDNYIRSLLEDTKGNFWVGTDTAGLLLFDRQKVKFTKRYKHQKNKPNSLPNNKIWKIYEDHNGLIWLATFGGGLCKFNPENETFTTYQNQPENKNSITGNKITAIYEDEQKNIWVGTFGNGICKFNPKTEQFKSYPSKLKHDFPDRIYAIHQDNEGKIWVAAEGCLKYYEPENDSFTEISYSSLNFSNPTLMAILEDEKNNFWIPTNNGLIQYNKNDGGLKTYLVSDGLQSNEFMIGAYLKTSNGEMIFGGINGLDVFTPSHIFENPNLPSVVITKFKVLNEVADLDTNIAYKKILELEYTDNEFSFEFVAIDYGYPSRNQYKYMLKGHDEHWISAENRHFASYTNLSPGEYTFKVRGSNNDGVWNNNETEIVIIIKPPFWQKTWFLILVGLIIVGSIFFLLKYRDISRDRKQLEVKVEERTAQIRQQNEEIAAQLEQIEEQKEYLHKSYKNIRLLSDVGQKITSHLAVESIIKTTAKNVGKLMDATVFGVGLHNKMLKRLDFKYVKNNEKTEDHIKISLRDKNNFSVWTFQNKKPVIINNFADEATNYISEEPVALLENTQIQSLISLPIMSGQTGMGVLTVQSPKPSKYNDYHLNILQNLATYIAIALENANSYTQIELQKRSITDSIFYARRIQEAILPPKKVLDNLLKNYFLYFKPRDIVSGDFYWVKELKIKQESVTIALAADCTGHGVPGAFMSMLGVSLLNELLTIYEKTIQNVGELMPHQILNDLRQRVINSLHQTGKFNEPQDGMDIALSIIDFENKKLKFSGANNPLFHISPEKNPHTEEKFKLTELKPDRMPIGYFLGKEKSFGSEEIKFENNDIVYMFSDGYTDQLGGKNERKFLKKRFKNLLLKNQELDMEQQKNELDLAFNKWISYKNQFGEPYEQLDDIVVLGIKLS